MTEMELIDRLNPKRDLPQVVCDAISQAWNVMHREEVKEQRNIIEAGGQVTVGQLVEMLAAFPREVPVLIFGVPLRHVEEVRERTLGPCASLF